MSMKQVNLMHIFLVGPLLTFIGYKNNNTPDYLYYALGSITSLLPFIVRIPKDLSYRSIVNSIHYLLWLPLFGLISYKGNELPTDIYGIILILGIVTILTHLYLFYK